MREIMGNTEYLKNALMLHLLQERLEMTALAHFLNSFT